MGNGESLRYGKARGVYNRRGDGGNKRAVEEGSGVDKWGPSAGKEVIMRQQTKKGYIPMGIASHGNG